jgi:hypothetical protein
MRRTADGRWPVDNGSELFDISVYQVRAAKTGSGLAYQRTGSTAPPMLDTSELTILSCWAEAVADALAFAPEQLEAVRADALAAACSAKLERRWTRAVSLRWTRSFWRCGPLTSAARGSTSWFAECCDQRSSSAAIEGPRSAKPCPQRMSGRFGQQSCHLKTNEPADS